MCISRRQAGGREKSEVDISILLAFSLHAFSLPDTSQWKCLSTAGGYVRWLFPHSDSFWSNDLPSSSISSLGTALFPVAFLNRVHNLYIIPLKNTLQMTSFKCAICFLSGLIDTVANKFPSVPCQPYFKQFLPLLRHFENNFLNNLLHNFP